MINCLIYHALLSQKPGKYIQLDEIRPEMAS